MLKPVVGGMVGALLYLPAVVAQPQVQQLSPQILAQAFPSQGASEAISPLEMQQFVQAVRQMKQVEMEAREKMGKVLKEENLSPQRFQEIGERRNNPEAPVSSEITPGEQERFDKAVAKIQTIQQETVTKETRAITFQGLTVERFNQIGQAIDKNPALKQQLQSNL